MPADKTNDIYIERHQIGSIMRVTAVDAATGTEVVFQAPANAAAGDIDRMAISKLKYVMAKKDK